MHLPLLCSGSSISLSTRYVVCILYNVHVQHAVIVLITGWSGVSVVSVVSNYISTHICIVFVYILAYESNKHAKDIQVCAASS